MKIRQNNLMTNYLSRLGYDFWDSELTLPSDLERIIENDFIVNDDCIILKGFGHNMNPKFIDDLDKCEWEYNETHFHPDSYIDTDNEIEFLKLALECGKRLFHRFEKQFENKKIRIAISFSETEFDENNIESYGSSTVRFYQIRPGAEKSMFIENLNDFKFDAIMEIEN